MPLLDSSGHAYAAISISGPTTRMEANCDRHLNLLSSAVSKISRTISRVEDITHDNLRLDIVTLIFKSSPFGELLNINNSQKFDNFTAIVC